jgi:hypothetical protein
MEYTHEDYVKAQQKHNKKMINAGATTIYSVGDLTSIYSADRDKYGAFEPHAGYKQAKAPYEEQYASYDGEIVGPSGQVKHTHVNNAGYAMVSVVVDGKPTTTTAHKLTCSAWVPNDDPAEKRTVDHIDSDKLNNSADNLRWLSYHDNLSKSHRMAQMSTKKGKQNGMPVVKVNADGTHTAYRSASAAGKANGLSAVSVTGNAKGQLKLSKPYHFIFK